MKKLSFLKSLAGRGRLELAEPSEEIKTSYITKSENCLKSAKILQKNKLYENSISEAYYSMYNALQALLSKTGIKCENHTASIKLLRRLFEASELYSIILHAKKERIDKQYYVESKQTLGLAEKSCMKLVEESEKFLIKIKLIISRTNRERAKQLREELRGALAC